MNIIKSFETETAHIVRNAVSRRCRFSVHGHSYKWEVTVSGNVNPINGMVLDFIELKPIKEFIDKFDHAMVLWNEDNKEFIDFFLTNCERILIMKKNTTAENMAALVHNFTSQWLKTIDKNLICLEVKVHETRTGCAVANFSDDDDVLVYEHNI